MSTDPTPTTGTVERFHNVLLYLPDSGPLLYETPVGQYAGKPH